MKKTKKSKVTVPELTEAELKRIAENAGFTFVLDKKKALGRPEKDLHQGDTVIIPEGASRGFKVKL